MWVHAATYYEHFDCLRLLVESNADLSARNNNGQTASIVSFHFIRIKLFWVHRAVVNGKIDALKVLVELGADISVLDDEGESPCNCSFLNASSVECWVILAEMNKKASCVTFLKECIAKKVSIDFSSTFYSNDFWEGGRIERQGI